MCNFTKKMPPLQVFSRKFREIFQNIHTLEHMRTVRFCKIKGETFWDILRSETIFSNWKPFKDDQKLFLSHLESSFRSQDI